MEWILVALLLAVAAGWYWRYRSHREVLRAMRDNRPVDLPDLPHPDSIALTQAYHRLRNRSRDELNILDSQRNELRALLAGMTEAVVAVDRAERVLSLNRAFQELFDCPADDVIGRSFLEVCRIPLLHEIVQEVLRSDLPIVRDVRIAGTPNREVQVSATPYQSPSHHRGAVLVIRDMSRIHQLEEHRRQFVANVSHELKTPITSIKGYAETLLHGALKDPDHAESFLKIILNQSNHLAALVEDLLQLSRIEQEEGELERDIQAIRPILADALDLSRELALQRKVQVHLECDPEFLVNCNAGMIALAVRNLVENAVKYSPEGSEVHVLAERAGENTLLQVRDNGAGIAAEHCDRLFERFYRIDKSRSKSLGGTGLGLAIVKHIAQAHGGVVRVDSAVGLGTTFTLEFPS